jgi:hypothetical protein
LEPLADAARQAGVDSTLLLSPLAWAYLDMGDVAGAAALLNEVTVTARAQNDRLVLVDALRIQAMVADRQGQWEAAVASLDEGLALARSMPYPYAEGRLLQVYGALQAQRGHLVPGRAHLEAAWEIFQRLGARRHGQKVETSLATLRLDSP